MVSIICNAYNHENYIRDALEGFVMQKTSFKFEVLIHDDASTDKTADIIRKYEKDYPDIIKPIYQTENQFSKGKGMVAKHQYPRVKGKYIALCEGDDHWIDENKLQKQVDFMEKNPNCVMTCHNSKRIDCVSGKEKIENPIPKTGYATAEDILVDKPGYWIATASIVYRKSIREGFPEFFRLPPVGDMPLRWYCFAKGDVYYFEDVMSVYNYKTPGSWSAGRRSKMKGDYFKFYEMYNEYTNYKYDKYVKGEIRKRIYNNAREAVDIKVIFNPQYRDLYKKIPLKNKIYFNVYRVSPWLLKTYHSIKSFMRK